MSEHHNTFATEKYLIEKLEAEVKAVRRYQTGQSIKTFVVFASLLSLFAVGGYALYTNPSFVADSIQYMRANGILNY